VNAASKQLVEDERLDFLHSGLVRSLVRLVAPNGVVERIVAHGFLLLVVEV
jgi:hypothetical protein